MALNPGTRLGVYDITGQIGEGGMGQVYRARDTKLDRDVAIKILPEAFADDAERLARFTREAKTLASLNHPNIAAIYAVEEGPAEAGHHVRALVMEFVEGEDLSQRITRGAIPLDEALTIARQIADALEAAHEQGIVHRDLKPANIKVRADGTVKVLDFGLAKLTGPAEAGRHGSTGEDVRGVRLQPDLSQSPTMMSPAQLSGAGMILGTAAYMSPEQARGKTVDKRADIWSFGCVLFEMLTGQPVFRGETITDILAAVVGTEPELSRVPWRMRRLVRSCLEKDSRRRLQAIGDAWLLIDEAAPEPPSSRRGRWLPWIAAAAMALLVAAGLWALWRQPIAAERAFQFQLDPPPGAVLVTGTQGGAAVSPDGRAVVFVAAAGRSALWIRQLDSLTARELPGTSGGAYPFWSPDGRAVGFFAEGKIKKVDVSGGPPVFILGAFGARGGSWGADGTIVFAPSIGAIQRIAASGGAPAPVTRVDPANGETAHRWPQLLPDGHHLLYWVRSSKPNRMGLYLGDLDHPEEKVFIVESSTAGAYAPSHGNVPGYVLWVRSGALMAQLFDLARARLSGDPVVVPGGEEVGIVGALNQSAFSLSREGTLLFNRADDRFHLAWLSREGKALGTVSTGRYAAVRMSPDGNRAAVSVTDESGNRDIWKMELARGLATRLTHETGNVMVWSPDGRQIAYHDSTTTHLFTVGVDGDRPQPVLESKSVAYINDWSPDGRFLMYTETSPTTGNDLWLLPTTGDRTPVPFLVTPFGESHGQFSPDATWIAYTSNESGQDEIYVRTVTGKGGTRVSTSGGSYSRWRRDGRELFYRSLDGRLMAAPVVNAGGRLTVGTPVPLFPLLEPLGTFAYPYDVAPDGQKILALTSGSTERDRALTVIVKWESGLRK
jgi:Tol biopolymer transport system component